MTTGLQPVLDLGADQPGGAPDGLVGATADRVRDRAYLAAIGAAALIGVAAIAYMVVKTFGLTGVLMDEVGLRDFLTGREWAPSLKKFGALPAIWGTLMASAIAMAIAVPFAIGVAIGTAVLLPPRLRQLAGGLVDLLAAIPSVVYGLWGVLVLAPAVKPALEWIARHHLGIGAFDGPVLGGSILVAGLVLAVMILPIITAVIREVVSAVPVDQREAALALGATRWEMIKSSILPAARSGIVGASALGLGRAVGETIAVAMVIGSQPNLFESLLAPGQTLAGTIANEYNSADGPLHASALVTMAILLFGIAFVVNLLARALVARSGLGTGLWTRLLRRRLPHRRARSAARTPRVRRQPPYVISERLRRAIPPRMSIVRSRRVRSSIAEVAIALSVVMAMVPLVLVLWYCVTKGAGALSLDFFLSDGEPDTVGNGIKHAIVGTMVLVGVATAIAVPIGILSALFLRECATRGPVARKVAAGMGVYIDMLLGVPSIVAGLVVSIVVVLGMGRFSALAGGIALAFIMYPITVRSADEMLRLVPQSQVEAALALGAPRWRVAWSVMLPGALPGITTGVMIAIARVAGETAPLVMTALGAQFFSASLLQPIASLPQYIFTGTISSTVPIAQEHSWGAALVLVTFVLILNLAARMVIRRHTKEPR